MFYEIANSPKVGRLAMEFGLGVYQVLAVHSYFSNFATTVSEMSSVLLTTQYLPFSDYKNKVSDKLVKDPALLCNKIEACLKRVRDGGDAAYVPVSSLHNRPI